MKRFSLALGCLLAAATMACSSASTGPANTYPVVAGTYDITAVFPDTPEATFTGTMTVADDSRDTPQFSGNFTFRFLNSSSTTFNNDISGALVNGSVDAAGNFRTDLLVPDFHLAGILENKAIRGSIVLKSGSATYSGAFTATRR